MLIYWYQHHMITIYRRDSSINVTIWKGERVPKKLLSYWHARASISAFKVSWFFSSGSRDGNDRTLPNLRLGPPTSDVHLKQDYHLSLLTSLVYWFIGQLWRLFRPSPKIYLFVCLRKIYKTHSTVYESLTLHRPTSASLVRLIVVFYQIRF